MQFINSIFFVFNVLKNQKQNAVFKKENPDFVVPPKNLAFDAYNHINWQHYYELGNIHANLISDKIQQYIKSEEINIYEWGCGPVRVLRHLENINGFRNVHLFGSDYNKKSIQWDKKNFPKIEFVVNSLNPPLSFESEQFDCVYAISIFTHLSEEMHYAWINELYRVLKKDGILIFTTHGELCKNRLLEDELLQYEKGEIVVRGKIKEGKKHFLAYHPHLFIKNKLLQNFEIIEHIEDPRKYQLEQEVWIVRKV